LGWWGCWGVWRAGLRAAVVLRYYEELPDRDIATLLGCRESTVRSLVARGLSTLRASVAEPARPREGTS
jgi:DNA-directed RNA polymerase specialized sigma24 family protein